MDPSITPTSADSPVDPGIDPVGQAINSLSRRGFLRVAGLAGGGLMAAGLAACQAATAPAWSFGAAASPGAASPAPASAGASAAASAGASAAASASVTPSGAPSGSPSASASPVPNLPAGWTAHDLSAQIKVRRFVGNLAGPLGLSGFLDNVLGPNTEPPSSRRSRRATSRSTRPVEADGTKVFDLTIDEISWPIDAVNPPVKGFGYNKMWPGPPLRVTEGDKVRSRFTNNLRRDHERPLPRHRASRTSAMDGVPFVTQLPFTPGETFTYEFTADPCGSLMYHSHHNATDQVGRGLLGAFIVEPKDPKERYDKKYGVTQDVMFIHNDALGGFTINGHGFPATTPIVAKQGEKVLIRFMNEGMHDAPVAHPRVPDARRRPRRRGAGKRLVRLRHAGRQPGRAVRRDHRRRPTRASGRSTATSCRTSRDSTACSAW